jgi:prepilin-type processing-associated H-X9-DG protein
MGRTHRGKSDQKSGGSSNCAFADGHVKQMTVVETIEQKAWGCRFFSLTGDTRVSDVAGGRPVE